MDKLCLFTQARSDWFMTTCVFSRLSLPPSLSPSLPPSRLPSLLSHVFDNHIFLVASGFPVSILRTTQAFSWQLPSLTLHSPAGRGAYSLLFVAAHDNTFVSTLHTFLFFWYIYSSILLPFNTPSLLLLLLVVRARLRATSSNQSTRSPHILSLQDLSTQNKQMTPPISGVSQQPAF